VVRLIGVYHADGTLLGELSYVAGRALGRAHCALCDITHGTFRRRPEWDACRSSLGVAFDTFHRNDQPPAVRSATAGVTPVVGAELADGTIVSQLDGAALDRCERSPDRLIDAVRSALSEAGLTL
jgi:hypothetical protein